MGTIKSWLLKWLGQEKYLGLTARIFLFLFRNGWLKNNPSYFTHYLVQELIEPGCIIIDIGANLGYYTTLFAGKTGINGKVFAVEPIELYRKVLEKNVAEYRQVTIFPYALGEMEGTIKMGNPAAQKYRHGLMKVLKPGETEGTEVYEVPVKNPLTLFTPLGKVDYIKCDIEGYEVPVIPAMKPLLEKHRPIMQVETDGENKHILFSLFTQMGYKTFYAAKNKLANYPDPNNNLPGDLIAIPSEKTDLYKHLMIHAQGK